MSEEIERIPVIIDTDPGVDDACAILLALASPELDILAITITFGNTNVENSYENLLKIWNVLQKHFEKHPEDSHRYPIFSPGPNGHVTFLARGSKGPLEGDLFDAESFHGRDGLSDISSRHPELSVPEDWKTPKLKLSQESAIDLSLKLIRDHPARSITYIALGPLTNLAQIVRKDAALVHERVGRVVAMGGAVDVAGNVTAVAEFNFYADPFAVRELLHPPTTSLGLPLNRFILLPLDITTKHVLRFPDYKKFVDPEFGTTSSPSRAENKSPLVHFSSSILEQTVEIMRAYGVDELELHDPLAVWCAICNPPGTDESPDGPLLSKGWTAQMRRFQIERTGELTRGMLVVDRRQDVKDADCDSGTPASVGVRQKRHQAPVVEVELKAHEKELLEGVQGVAIVTKTPGSETLAKLMMSRIWGVEI